MTEPNTLKRVPLSEVGEGVCLALRVAGVRELYQKFGDEWMMASVVAIENMNPEICDIVLRHSGEKDGKPIELAFDAIAMKTVPLPQLTPKLLDAYCWGVFGRSHADQVKVVEKEAEEFRAKLKQSKGLLEENPTTALADGSAGSSEKQTNTDSAQTSSTV